MKVVVVIIDGLSDEPIPELGGETPLESAFAPHTAFIAGRGRVGCIETTFPGLPIESMVCIMGLLGYDPHRFYPGGRSSLEAAAKGIPVGSDDLVLRCNTVTVDTERDVISDFTAAQISDADARSLIARMVLPAKTWELFPGQSYRHVLIVRGAAAVASSLVCAEPHMHMGEPIEAIVPRGKAPAAARLASELTDFLRDSRRQIAAMDLPRSCAANMLWVWSPSRKAQWPSFRELTGMSGACVGGLDFLHGIAMTSRIHFDVIPGATGYIDTDYEAKARYALAYLEEFDFVLVHVNAADEEAHRHNPRGKVAAIERVDRFIVGPLLERLIHGCRDGFRIVVCGDHGTRCSDGRHTGDPVPYAAMGPGIPASNTLSFSEATCRRSAPIPSLSFLRELLE